MRGMLTPAIEELADELLGIDITTQQLRFMAHIQYLAMNHKPIDQDVLSEDDIETLSDWMIMRHIVTSDTHVSVSKEFWSAMSQILWEGYINA